MSNILTFKSRPSPLRGIFSDCMQIYFPPIYRSLASMTSEQVAEFDVSESIIPFKDYVLYSFGEIEIVGQTERSAVDSISEPDGPTLIVRHHATSDEAHQYLNGVIDAGISYDDCDAIVKTDDGYFTMFKRATLPKWPGPMIFYSGKYACEKIGGFDYWEAAVGPGGTMVEPTPSLATAPGTEGGEK